MKRALAILLLMLTLTLWGAEGRGHVPAAPLVAQERLELYSYSYLGVEVKPFSDEEFAAFKAKLAPPPEPRNGTLHMVPGEPAYLLRRTGLLITRVLPDSPAERGGLEEGDVIMMIGGARMTAPTDLLTVLRNCTPDCTMHMMLIGKDLRWKYAMPIPEEHADPAHVGYIVPRTLSGENLRKMKAHQLRAIELLASNPVPVKEACDELEAICRLLFKDYTPGCLRIPLRSGDCSITATRYGWNIEVIMQEGGRETKGSVKRWVWEDPRRNFSPAHPGPDVLPETIRRRLLEIDCPQPLAEP